MVAISTIKLNKARPYELSLSCKDEDFGQLIDELYSKLALPTSSSRRQKHRLALGSIDTKLDQG